MQCQMSMKCQGCLLAEGLSSLYQEEMLLLGLNTDLFCIKDSIQESLVLCLMQRIWQLLAHCQNTA